MYRTVAARTCQSRWARSGGFLGRSWLLIFSFSIRSRKLRPALPPTLTRALWVFGNRNKHALLRYGRGQNGNGQLGGIGRVSAGKSRSAAPGFPAIELAWRGHQGFVSCRFVGPQPNRAGVSARDGNGTMVVSVIVAFHIRLAFSQLLRDTQSRASAAPDPVVGGFR